MNGFLVEALIFLAASILLVPIFQRLGLGSVLGYLIAGIVIGPSGLKLINDSESVLHFAELGVVLLLFVIGLEIRPDKLWQMKKDLLKLGGSEMLLGTILFSGLIYLYGEEVLSALILGFALSFSSTAYALQTLMDKNNFNTEFGKSSFSVLLMQDLLAIPALAVIPLLGNQNGGGDNKLLFFFPVFVIMLVLVNRFLMRPFFRLIGQSHSREIFTATALFIVLGVSVVMMKIGLSAALGSFIAGVFLADSEYRHELEANLDPFKSLLMGLFFIAVGMSVSLSFIMERPLLVFSFVAVYLTSKVLIIYGIGRFSGIGNMNSRSMAFTIAQGGEFAFVIFGLAFASGLLNRETVQLFTAVITLSMAINPLLLFANERLQSRKLSSPAIYDEIKGETSEVIIAGFGRFGQMFGRILKAQKIPFVAIDHDADQIELLRKFGNKVYFGDASRMDILESAGIKGAKYFVLAIDNVELSLKTARLIKEHFPHVKIFARARNRGHHFDLLEIGVHKIKRETIDSSLNFTGDLLQELGFEKEKAKRVIEKFRRHDELMLLEQYKVRDDDKKFISTTEQGTAQLADVLNEETEKTYFSPIPADD